MNYYKTIKSFTITDKKKLIEIPENTYMFQVDDRNDRHGYVTSSGIVIDGLIVSDNPSYFTVVSEREYKMNNVNILKAVSEIEKIIEDTGLSAFQIIEKLDAHFGIVRQWNTPSIQPYNPYPSSPNPYDVTCSSCGKKQGEACFSIACPNRLNIIYCSK
jgi:hypothetical protein